MQMYHVRNLSMLMYTYKILDCQNYDGDSLNLTLDVGFHLQIYRKCRLYAVDTPELRSKATDHILAARLAKSFVSDFVSSAMADDAAYFASERYTGKFGRTLGNVLRIENGTVMSNLRDQLLSEKLAVPYYGESKSAIADLHAANIQWLKDWNRI